VPLHVLPPRYFLRACSQRQVLSDGSGPPGAVWVAMFLQPDSAAGKYYVGVVRFSMGQIAKVERSAQALALDPGESDASVLLRWIH
jgi:hypothetical protein